MNWDISKLLDVLQSLSNTKNLTITYLDICLDNEFDPQITEDIFQKAVEIIEKKFPRNSTAFDIGEIRHAFTIKKKKGKAPTFKFPKNCRAKLRSFSSFVSSQNT